MSRYCSRCCASSWHPEVAQCRVVDCEAREPSSIPKIDARFSPPRVATCAAGELPLPLTPLASGTFYQRPSDGQADSFVGEAERGLVHAEGMQHAA